MARIDRANKHRRELIRERPKNNTPSKPLPTNWMTIYTDASWHDNDKEGSYGIWLRHEKGRITVGGRCPVEIQSSCDAEMYAVLRGIYNTLINYPDVEGFYIRTDSKHVIHRYTTFQGKTDIELRMIKMYRILVGKLPVNIKHVKGHQGTHTTKGWLNDWCDKESTRQRKGGVGKEHFEELENFVNSLKS